MKRIIALILAVLTAVCALASCGGEKKDWDYISDKGKMVIGITYFEPMNYKKDGKLTGFETEFAEAVCDKLGVKPDFQEIEWDSKEVELKSKSIDCIWNGLTITDERKENMDISTPYMENKQVMVVKKANAKKYAKSVKDAKVIAEAGSAGEEVAKGDKFFKGSKYTAADSQAKALMEVKSGTSDIAVIDYVMSIGTLTSGSDYADLAVVEGKDFSPEQYGIAFRKDSPETLKKVNEAIQAVADDGKLDKIADKYNLKDLILVKGK